MRKSTVIDGRRSSKIVWYIAQILWWLGWLAAGMILLLLIVINLTGFHIKYIHLPIEVVFDESNDCLFADRDTESKYLPINSHNCHDKVVEAGKISGHQSALLMIPAILLAGYLFIIFHLRRFLHTILHGQPYHPDNPYRLRLIGYAVAVVGPIYGLFNFIYGLLYIGRVNIPNASLDVSLDIHPFVIFLGLVILAISHAFAVGVRLQKEQDLTI